MAKKETKKKVASKKKGPVVDPVKAAKEAGDISVERLGELVLPDAVEGDDHVKSSPDTVVVPQEISQTPVRRGRPTSYSKQILIDTQQYIDDCKEYYERIFIRDEFGKPIMLPSKHTDGGFTPDIKTHFRVNLPSIAGLSVHLRVSRETIYAWKEEEDKKEFSDMLDEIMALQEARLLEGGLSGVYNSNITKLGLTKHGYTDKAEVDVKGLTLRGLHSARKEGEEDGESE